MQTLSGRLMIGSLSCREGAGLKMRKLGIRQSNNVVESNNVNRKGAD